MSWGRHQRVWSAVFLLLALLPGTGCRRSSSGGGNPTEATPTLLAGATATPLLPLTPTPLASATMDVGEPTRTSTPTPTQPPPSLTPVGSTPTASPAPWSPSPVPTDGPPTLLPTSTPSVPPPPATATPLTGPQITALEIASTGGQFNLPVGTDREGRPVFSRNGGTGFVVFAEARPGMSQLPVSSVVFNPKRGDASAVPDLQVTVSQPLGNGSPTVCDASLPLPGGVPPRDPGAENELAHTDALNDLGCRFRVYTEPDFACTQDSGSNFTFRNPASTIQFCMLANEALEFPEGDTIITVRLRDIAGNAGPARQVVLRRQ